MLPKVELLDDNLQTYEEFRAQVDREEYGITPELIHFPEVKQEKPQKNPKPEEIQIFPAA